MLWILLWVIILTNQINMLILFFFPLLDLTESSSFCPWQALMKSFVVNGSDPAKPEKFLAYMVPAPEEVLYFCHYEF